MILGWTVLRPSARERRLRLMALAGTLLTTCLLTLAALLADPRHPAQLWSAVVICAVITAGLVWRLQPRNGPLEIAIDAQGQPLLRATPGVADPAAVPSAGPARCLFAAPWLITLRCGTLRAAIWPDCLPADAFRRLHACVRWAGAAAPDPSSSAPAPDPS